MSADTITDKNSSGIQQLDKSPSSTISVEIPAQQNMDPQVVSLEDVETNDISTASSLENPSDPQMGTHFVSPDVTTLTHSSSDSEIRDKKTGFMSLPDELMIIKIKVYVPNTPYDRKYRLPRARWRSGNTPYNYHVSYGKVSNIIVNSNKYLFEVAPENVIFSTDQFAPSILAVSYNASIMSRNRRIIRFNGDRTTALFCPNSRVELSGICPLPGFNCNPDWSLADYTHLFSGIKSVAFAPFSLCATLDERAWLLSQFRNLDRIVLLCNQGYVVDDEMSVRQMVELDERVWLADRGGSAHHTLTPDRESNASDQEKRSRLEDSQSFTQHADLKAENEAKRQGDTLIEMGRPQKDERVRNKCLRLFIELMHNSNNETDESWLEWRDVDSNDEIVEWEYSDDEKYLEDEDRGQLDVQSKVPEVTRSQDSIKDEDITFRDFFETLAIIVACFVSLSALIDYGLFAFLAWLGFEFDDTGYNCGADLDLVLDLLPYGMPSGQERI
ncbi:hypothetical protein BKA61DRAFT_578545 [Leptodontidium sp. MPI-SDFR-AT-0119]|nr:hypothetical protein BKA61DRAFT_578545 [Leptodontidium sp. MPI-SDFR-AT-0119]